MGTHNSGSDCWSYFCPLGHGAPNLGPAGRFFFRVSIVCADHRTVPRAHHSRDGRKGAQVISTNFSDAFSKRAMSEWDSQVIVPTINELIDGWAQNGSADLVADLTFPLPIRVIAKLLGLPAADVEWFQRSAAAIVDLEGDAESEVQRQRATAEISDYFRDVIAERRRSPRSDVISLLITGEVEGQRLDD